MKMRRSLIAFSVAMAVAAVPAVCLATPPTTGGYMSVFLGASVPQDSSLTTSQFNPVSVREATVQYDPGINIGGTGGYDFGYVRLEGEMSYKQGEITSVTDQIFGARYVNTDGHVGAFAMLMNGFFDIHNDTPITPYLGGGMGFATVYLSNTRGVEANTGALNFRVLQDDDETAFAYQVGAGLEAALNRRLSLDVGYRYFGTSRVSFRKNWPNSTDLKLDSHNAAVGLRIKF
jgi:opacity protein-like surface antigen